MWWGSGIGGGPKGRNRKERKWETGKYGSRGNEKSGEYRSSAVGGNGWRGMKGDYPPTL